MKIRKVLDKKVGDTAYFKYLITLPKNIVEDSGFLDKEIFVKLEEGKIIINKNIKEDNKQNLTDKEKMLQKELIKLFEKQKNK
jgi:hypothetical protein